MPIVHSLEKTMAERIDEFYGSASVYRSNKFLVGFFGEYVAKAVAKMEKESKFDSGIGIKDVAQRKKMFDYNTPFSKWKSIFHTIDKNAKNESVDQVEMKWACHDITIPHTTSKVETKNYIDSIKSIKYPVITGVNDSGKILINVRDDKNLMWYQFFNAIINQFYSAQILKPKSSFQKLGMYVAVLQEQYVKSSDKMESGLQREYGLDTIPSQVFEFNSIVLTDIGTMNINNDSKEIMEYKVTFDAPNTFQGSFNDVFRGLRDNTSLGVDKAMMESATKYNRGEFEIDKLKLKTNQNGWYPD